jgi:hypothetical protein
VDPAHGGSPWTHLGHLATNAVSLPCTSRSQAIVRSCQGLRTIDLGHEHVQMQMVWACAADAVNLTLACHDEGIIKTRITKDRSCCTMVVIEDKEIARSGIV